MDDLDFPQEKAGNEVVRFYLRPVVDKDKTREAGRPVHVETPYVEISNPGDRTNVVDRAVREFDKERYPRQWLAFQANKPQDSAVGTLLTAWGQLTPAVIEDLRYFKITTVEQLAGVTDANLTAMGMGARRHRQQAQEFIEAAKSSAPLLRAQEAIEQRDAEIAALRNALSEQGERMDRIEAAAREAAPKQAQQAKARG